MEYLEIPRDLQVEEGTRFVWNSTLARTLWFRQVALDYRHDLPVLTVLVLLRKEANSPSLTGR